MTKKAPASTTYPLQLSDLASMLEQTTEGLTNGSCRYLASRLRIIDAARPPALDRDAVALEIWHRFANSNVQTFEDETHKAEYLLCADAILALLRPAAGEAVYWQVNYKAAGWCQCREDEIDYFASQGMKTRALYAHPAPTSDQRREGK